MPIKSCGPNCTTEDKNSGRCGDPQLTYVGCVLDTYERNGYDDSDFYALAWDESTQSVKAIQYGTTRFWTYHDSASIDATDDVKRKARAWYAERAFNAATANLEAKALVPEVGDTVRSLFKKGRKVGLVGTVETIRDDAFRRVYDARLYQPKVYGVRVEGRDGLVWMPDDKAERTTPRVSDLDELKRHLTEWCQRANWRSMADYPINLVLRG